MTSPPWKARYDAVSGLAGGAAAKALSGGGFKAAVIEKAKLPRCKMRYGVPASTSVKFLTDHFGSIPEKILSLPRETSGAWIHTVVDGPLSRVRNSISKGEADKCATL